MQSAIIKQDTKLHELLLKYLQLLHSAKVPIDFVNVNREDKDGKLPYQKQLRHSSLGSTLSSHAQPIASH